MIDTAWVSAPELQSEQYGTAMPAAILPYSGEATKNSYPKVTIGEKRENGENCQNYSVTGMKEMND